jgi:hypothetical protein
MANEKRLIDANALMESKWWDSLKDDFDKARAKIIVQSCPTVDAVEVVRCKDCKRFDVCFPTPYIKKLHELAFCSYGERRDNGSAQI